jgi:hypothetical protein
MALSNSPSRFDTFLHPGKGYNRQRVAQSLKAGLNIQLAGVYHNVSVKLFSIYAAAKTGLVCVVQLHTGILFLVLGLGTAGIPCCRWPHEKIAREP